MSKAHKQTHKMRSWHEKNPLQIFAEKELRCGNDFKGRVRYQFLASAKQFDSARRLIYLDFKLTSSARLALLSIRDERFNH
jgi:hypothetical protein